MIDESQGCFPPRSSAAAAPAHVAWLNTHRHKGFDIWLSTQHPKLIDYSVRALVGKHQHYRRIFGMARSIVYEWDACSDGLAGLSNATKSYYKYPRNIYKLYKSAEIHTKQSFKLPLWLLLPFIAVALGIYSWPRAYAVLFHPDKGLHVVLNSTPPDPVDSVAKTHPVPLPSDGAKFTLAAPAPVRKERVPDTELISACLATAKRCICFNHNGIHIPMSEAECRYSAEHVTDRFRLDLRNVVVQE